MALRSFVWPKSHLAVHRYFKEHPEDIAGLLGTAGLELKIGACGAIGAA